MFKQAALAAAAALAFTAAPAAAAVTITYVGGTVITTSPTGPEEEAGNFTFVVNSATPDSFTATYTFYNVFDPAKGTATATFSSTDADSIAFTGAAIDGLSGVLEIANPEMNAASVYVWQSPLAEGWHTLTISGNFNPAGNQFATVGGTLTLNAVPEPATWALFILGFGAVGHTMRRRNGKVRVAKASLHFA